jgi:hypothetical protein
MYFDMTSTPMATMETNNEVTITNDGNYGNKQ